MNVKINQKYQKRIQLAKKFFKSISLFKNKLEDMYDNITGDIKMRSKMVKNINVFLNLEKTKTV